MPPFIHHRELDSLHPLGQRIIKSLKRLNRVSFPRKKTHIPLRMQVDELNELLHSQQPFELIWDDFFLQLYDTPRFTCWNHLPETAKLQEIYLNTRKTIREAYQQGSFLEVTLTQWTAPLEEAL